MNNVGVVFASTGGQKIVRALRSLRRGEPDIPIHIVLDVSSGTWRNNCNNPSLDWFVNQPNVKVRYVSNTFYINGTLNEGMRWMKELGYGYGCLFHDDVIFSPLGIHSEHLSEAIQSPLLKESSGLSFSLLQVFVPTVWRREPSEWDKLDLESESLWEKLFLEGSPVGYYTSEEKVIELHLPEFYIQYRNVKNAIKNYTRLGPTGMIVPIDKWEEMGGFDTKGIFYDIEYPAECKVRGWPPITLIPNIPHLHLHNQSIGFSDLAKYPWNDTEKAFKNKYGMSPLEFWGGYV